MEIVIEIPDLVASNANWLEDLEQRRSTFPDLATVDISKLSLPFGAVGANGSPRLKVLGTVAQVATICSLLVNLHTAVLNWEGKAPLPAIVCEMKFKSATEEFTVKIPCDNASSIHFIDAVTPILNESRYHDFSARMIQTRVAAGP